MTYPTDDPIHKLILANVVTSLEGIDGASPYRTEVSNVVVAGLNPFDLGTYPAIAVGPARMTFTDTRHPLTSCEMSFNVLAVIRASPQSVALAALYDLIEDVKLALTEDVTRGGSAMDTHVESSDPFVPDTAEPYVGSAMRVSIIYRHLRTDPSAAF